MDIKDMDLGHCFRSSLDLEYWELHHVYIKYVHMYIYICFYVYTIYTFFLEHKIIMQLSDCLSEDPRLISPFLAILGTSIQKIRAIKPFQAFLRTSWNRRNHPRKVGGSSAKHGWHTNFAKRTEAHINQQQWQTITNTIIIAWMNFCPTFWGTSLCCCRLCSSLLVQSCC